MQRPGGAAWPARGERNSVVAIDSDAGKAGVTGRWDLRRIVLQPLSLHRVRFVFTLEPTLARAERAERTGPLLHVMNDLVDNDAAIPKVVFRIEPVVKIDGGAAGVPSAYVARTLARHLLKFDVRHEFNERRLGRPRISGEGLHHVQQIRNQSGDACRFHASVFPAVVGWTPRSGSAAPNRGILTQMRRSHQKMQAGRGEEKQMSMEADRA